MGQISNDEHVFIAGMTGSGKTFLIQNYLPGVDKKVFVLDTKGTFEWPQIPDKKKTIVSYLKDMPDMVSQYDRIIYRPAREELIPEFYNAFFEYCYYLQNCTVVVDEVMQVCPSPARIPEFYKGILTRGRELNVNVWSATQRPATIPVVVYSEATHWFIFKLNSAMDRKRLADFTGFSDFNISLPKQVFLYYNANTGSDPEKGRLIVRG